LKYENKNELILFWTLGISKIEFIKNVTKFSLLMMVVMLVFTSYITPSSGDTARSFIRNSNIDFFPSLIKEKKFLDAVNDLTFYINEQNREEGLMKNIFLKEQKKGSKKFKIIFAKEGQLINRNGKNFLILKDGEIFNNNSNGDFTNINFENFEFNLSNYTTKTTTAPKIQEINTLNMLKCFLNNNYKKNYKMLKDQFICKADSNEIIIQELLKRLYLPLFLPLIGIIGSLLILQSKVKKNFNKYKFFIFLIGFFIIFTSEMSVKYANTNINVLYSFFLIPIFLFIITFSIFLKKQNNI
jgi:lipopolysaccharide export system permease protein